MTPFDQAFRIAIGEEGGFTTNPADPGNWTGGTCGKGACRGTKFGIAASAHPDLDIASISLDQAKQIYHAEYWSHVQGDDMPPPWRFSSSTRQSTAAPPAPFAGSKPLLASPRTGCWVLRP